MRSLSKSKVYKDIAIGNQPVEIQIREGFADTEVDLEDFQDDPQVKAILGAARREAEYIKNTAREEAQAILEQAQRERDAFVEAARQEGLAQGYDEGFAEGGKQAKLLQEQAEHLLAQARKAYQGVMSQAEPNLLELSLLIGEKILRQQIALEPETIRGLAKELLKEVHAGETFFIYVNPKDINLLLEAQQELKEVSPAGVALHIVSDKNISQGGCRLETEEGYFDATIEGQLAQLKKLLQGGVANVKPSQVS